MAGSAQRNVALGARVDAAGSRTNAIEEAGAAEELAGNAPRNRAIAGCLLRKLGED
jgi:hypothetical protein